MEKVCKVTEVLDGSMKGFTVGSNYILIANVDNKYYAMDAVCPHRSGYLPVGTLKNKILTCPVHGAQYDITTGKLLQDVSEEVKNLTGNGATDLNMYRALIIEDSVYIEL
jgi:nitrite reductase/ring-hydroxylating ferredoxin subunit